MYTISEEKKKSGRNKIENFVTKNGIDNLFWIIILFKQMDKNMCIKLFLSKQCTKLKMFMVQYTNN